MIIGDSLCEGLVKIAWGHRAFARDSARFLNLAYHDGDSGSNLVQILSPMLVDKFVDNLKKNIMPY